MTENKEKRANRVLEVSFPVQAVLPDTFSLAFELKDDSTAHFRYEEEFSDKKTVDNTMALLERFYEMPGISLTRHKNQIKIEGEAPVTWVVGAILGEILPQAIYFLGQDGVEHILKTMFHQRRARLEELPKTLFSAMAQSQGEEERRSNGGLDC